MSGLSIALKFLPKIPLGNDPEIHYMPNGTSVATLNIATNDGYKNKTNGQFIEKTEWHKVSVFGQFSEILNN